LVGRVTAGQAPSETNPVGTTETITEREIIYPSPWIAGRSATDSVVLHTQPCPIVG
jgi:hypothetical protein